MNTHSKAHLAVLGTNLFFAANYSLVKFISPSHIGPFGLNVFRVGISLALFWMLWAFSKSSPGIRKEHWMRFALCGLCGVAVNQLLFIKGLTMTSTIHASLLMLCTPLLITLFAFWILKEKITLAKLLGLAMGIGGAVLLILSKEKTGNASLSGDILIVMNAIAYTLYFILVKPLMAIYPPLHVVRWVFSFGFILMLPFGWSQAAAVSWDVYELKHLLSLGFIIICGTFLAYSFNIYGIKHLGAGITGSYIYTQPVIAAIIAILILNEQFTIEKGVAGLLIFCGVFLVSRRSPTVVEE